MTQSAVVEGLQFRDEEFLSASEKRLILNAWITFLRHGCLLEHFSQRLYDHLYLHCSFIAHYDRHGFYDFYFSKPNERTARFLDQFDPDKPGISAELGAAFWLNHATGADLNQAMREVAGPYIAKLRHVFSEKERQADLAVASRLAAKYGKQLSDGPASPASEASSWVPAIPAAADDSTGEQLSMFSPKD